MAIMLLNDWGEYMGLSPSSIKGLYKAGRITGVTVLRKKIRVVDSETAQILPNPNYPRRIYGQGTRIGQSKPLRGEPGFVERQRKSSKKI